ncbi:hypothetical protein EAG18_01250 [Pseudoalteromonas sp. J010]|nr:hypothetical protein EAG18_01250 [Pseudoalteromonas sp. J010]
MSITRQKFCYLVVLNKKFLTRLASGLLPQIEQVIRQIGIGTSLICASSIYTTLFIPIRLI